MKILVTGANGMLGQDLCPALEDAGYFVVETGRNELDITDFQIVEKVLNEVKPQIVVNCAAYVNVDAAENDLETAEAVNVQGTENLAKICAKLDAVLVHISTDYVFDGTKAEPYTPQDIPNPLNHYGLTKLRGEEAVKRYCEKYYIVRTSLLYGHHGSNFVETMINLAGTAPEIKVVDDQVGAPTWTVELADGILKILDKPYGIYHVCGGGGVSRYGLAKEIFALCGLEVDLKPCKTEDFPRPAKRPPYSVMDNDGLCRNWKAALKDYLALRV